MCGIVGALSRDNVRPNPDLVRQMARAIAHRGPDGEGVASFPAAALGHRRLSIIDLSSAAAQPMSSPDGQVAVAFNGEIYNFRELRAELEQLGRTFRTSSDTEVVLAAWLEWGTAAVARLDGMFAIALWDERTHQLLLARDRTGKKPLFVYEDARRFLFASEQKALFAWPGLDAAPNPLAVVHYLSHGYVPTPATFHARVRTVRPATWELHDTSGLVREHVFWDFPLGPERRVSTADELAEVEAELRRLFFAAVDRRLVADVPLGAFLSGGVDSTLVVAAMAQRSPRPVKTFSIGIEGHPEWDETRWARMVAERYGTDHTEFKVRPESLGLLEELSRAYDEPFGDSSCVPTAIVSRLTRQHVTVALTGDGGDEVFAGYPRFFAASIAERVPGHLRSLARRVLPLVPTGRDHHAPLERARRLASAMSRELPERLRAWMTFFTAEELRELLTPELARLVDEGELGASYARLIAHARARGADVVNQLLYANARTYLLDDLNVKTDRASMMVGLETRSPFLDTALMEFAFSLPGHTKLRGRTTKWILKRALADLVPEEIRNRPKMGFGIPLGAWLRDEQAKDLGRARAPLLTAVRAPAFDALTARHAQHGRDLGPQLFLLKMLELFLAREAEGQLRRTA